MEARMEDLPLGIVSKTVDGSYELRFERDLPHAPHQVWKVISSQEGLARWLSEAAIELRPGGSFRLWGQCSVEGQVVEVKPHCLLSWTWPHPDHPLSEVRISLTEPSDGRSHITLVQTGLPQQHLLDVATGWHTHLDALPGAVVGRATQFDIKRAAMHYRTYAKALSDYVRFPPISELPKVR
ncbi:MAG: hypothetical protein CFE28_06285 [Alphaproteobacteria bacterium PA2]|nr:MAG: hypothetical protein CFE28_06285 [Alphaproteobacteria bacterium PA2]